MSEGDQSDGEECTCLLDDELLGGKQKDMDISLYTSILSDIVVFYAYIIYVRACTQSSRSFFTSHR